MGRKNNKKTKAGGGSAAAKEASIDSLEDSLSDLFKTLPPIKRAELNKVVEKLFQVCSNFADEPTTPAKQWSEFQDISGLVETVREIEKGYSMCRTLPDRKNAVKPFTKWIEDLGGVVNGVEVTELPGQGLGLRATKDLKEGDEVMSIPVKAMMSVETAKASSIGSLIDRDPLLQTMSNVVLAVHLLIERNSPASIWEPYINILPHTYSTVLYFTPSQLAALRGSPALEDALKHYKFVARQYAYFYRLFANTLLKDYLTYDEYRWAVSTVMTRQNMVPKQDDPNTQVNTLIPFYDLANHDHGQLSTDYDTTSSSTTCLAQRDFSSGEQFTIFYGVRANCDLLVHNGFVFPDNQHDCLTIKLGVARTDPLATARNALLQRLGVSSNRSFHLTRTERPLDSQLTAFLRVLQMDQAQMEEWQAKAELGDLLDIDASTAVDGKMMQYMITRAALLLRSYPTTLEQDQEKLKQTKNQIDLMTCQLLLCEKRILVNTVAYCEQQLKTINANK